MFKDSNNLIFAKVLRTVGIAGAGLILVLACYIYAGGRLPMWVGIYPYWIAAIIFPIYIIGIALRRLWAFYIAFGAFLFWLVFWLFLAVILQHAIFFLESSRPPFLEFEKVFWLLSWPWWVSVILSFCGIIGSAKLLEAKYNVKFFAAKECGKKDKSARLWEILIISAVLGGFLGVLLPALARTRHSQPITQECGAHVQGIGKCMQLYSEEFRGRYPLPDKWCDVLLEGDYADKEVFKCPGAKTGRSNYAINPLAEPNSPNDVVLLFETKEGWNQFGGPELLTTKNHKGKGCNILFNDKHVGFIKETDIGKLNWGSKQTK